MFRQNLTITEGKKYAWDKETKRNNFNQLEN